MAEFKRRILGMPCRNGGRVLQNYETLIDELYDVIEKIMEENRLLKNQTQDLHRRLRLIESMFIYDKDVESIKEFGPVTKYFEDKK